VQRLGQIAEPLVERRRVHQMMVGGNGKYARQPVDQPTLSHRRDDAKRRVFFRHGKVHGGAGHRPQSQAPAALQQFALPLLVDAPLPVARTGSHHFQPQAVAERVA
jgi:hypothetical protein